MNIKEQSILKKEAAWISFFSHHPPCGHFQEHTFRLGKRHFCIGCYIGYPSGILSIIITSLWVRRQNVNISLLFYAALVGFIISFLPSVLNLTHRKMAKIVQKVGLGLFGGGFLVALYHLLPLSPFYKALNIFLVFSIIMAPIFLRHYFSMRKICDECPDKWNHEKCPIQFCLAKRSTDGKILIQQNFANNTSSKLPRKRSPNDPQK
ncbi:MAG: hypothetical protein DRO88_03140 [Promethearchaeia archaeon]|nr:MAG: hypothetical protein DRO88_03140 [Candidatus Lokiarchaeia archaeon]